MNHRILFVCLGNICRSPAADGIMRSLVEKRGAGHLFEIDSAGTSAWHAGELPDPRMRAAGRRRGYNFDHRSRQFRAADYDRFDHIVVMDDQNYEAVCRLAPDRQSLDKVSRMTDYNRNFNMDHVPDPYYQGHKGFEYVLDILEDACEGLLRQLDIE